MCTTHIYSNQDTYQDLILLQLSVCLSVCVTLFIIIVYKTFDSEDIDLLITQQTHVSCQVYKVVYMHS